MQTHKFYEINGERAEGPSLSFGLPGENSKTQLSLNNKYQEGAGRYGSTDSSLNVLAILESTTETPTGYPRLLRNESWRVEIRQLSQHNSPLIRHNRPRTG